MFGNLASENVPSVLRRVHRSRMSGILHFLEDDQSIRIYFKHGEIVFAGSDNEKDRLGEALLRTGRLTRPLLENSLRLARDSGRSLADYLVDANILSLEIVVAEAMKRMLSIVYSVFALTGGEYLFETGENPVEAGKAMSLSLSDAMLEGIRRIEDNNVVRDGVGSLKQILVRPTKPAIAFGPASLNANEVLVYELSRSLGDGKRTLEKVVDEAPLEKDSTLRSLFGLLSIGALETKYPPGNTRLELPKDSGRNTKRSLGRYQVLQSIGRGAMGEVLLARDPAMDRMVAIKLIHAAEQMSPLELEKHRARFSREAKAAGKLLHPGIVTVFDVGHAGEKTPFLVMEYVPGSTLRELIDELSIEETLRIADDVLEAIDYAHSKGIVHRDIKPSNILVSPDLHAKILDFGIAHIMGAELTDAPEVLGSPSYMAPEQLTRDALDRRTDLFSFGVVLYRALTRKMPFPAETVAGITHAIVNAEPLPLNAVNPLVPEALSQIVLRCLKKSPGARFENASELKDALRQFRAGPERQSTGAAASLQPKLSTSPPPQQPTDAQESTPIGSTEARFDAPVPDDGSTTQPTPSSPAVESEPRAKTPEVQDLIGSLPSGVMLVGSTALLFLAVVALGMALSGRSANAPQIDAADRPRIAPGAAAALGDTEITQAQADATERTEEDVQNQLDQAETHLNARRFVQAESILDGVLQQHPSHGRAQRLLDTLRKRRRPPKPKPLPRNSEKSPENPTR